MIRIYHQACHLKELGGPHEVCIILNCELEQKTSTLRGKSNRKAIFREYFSLKWKIAFLIPSICRSTIKALILSSTTYTQTCTFPVFSTRPSSLRTWGRRLQKPLLCYEDIIDAQKKGPIGSVVITSQQYGICSSKVHWCME